MLMFGSNFKLGVSILKSLKSIMGKLSVDLMANARKSSKIQPFNSKVNKKPRPLIRLKRIVENTIIDKKNINDKIQNLNILTNPNFPHKRCVIVDGCNVGYAHSVHTQFSVEGLQICLDHFAQEGHPAIAIVPRRRAHSNTNPSLLQQLSEQKRVLFSPYDNEFGSCSDTYDDKCILSLAAQQDGVVISNDNFRDIINYSPEWRHVIETRVIPYCFFKDMFMVPRDPYGPDRPGLEQILTKGS